ncbi:DUF4271 domain-containing protein [Olivibacter domesticus]|uniref:DUF4271 domain-containing protein n=1 Tax=Olivibacter domesticus TaxID=407022 RepID=A0A1H7X9F5_OLID1|nr:DUF4271 domain-containing protein [Olivibacter domesticus]SEM30264.1 protein of unknown function [Olivibacter domesticus]
MAFCHAFAVQDSSTNKSQDSTYRPQKKISSSLSLKRLVQDSARFARALEKQRIKDSLERREDSLAAVRDSLMLQYIKPLSDKRKNYFLDSLKKVYIIRDANSLNWGKDIIYASTKKLGTAKVYREPWILIAVFSLVLFLALIRISFIKDLQAIATSFYSNRVLLQISKEDNLITSWPFVFLYLLFGFTTGLFLYLYVSYYHFRTGYNNVGLFFTISGIVLILFVLKIVITRGIGFVFGVQRLVRDYISILYLSYFNAALIFIPLLLVLSLVPASLINAWIIISCVFVLLVFAMQFIRASGTVLKSYQFSKFYLFIYLCTLEVGPILILIKLLGI